MIPPCFAIRGNSRSPRSSAAAAPLFLPFSIRPKITNSNSFHSPIDRSLRASRLRSARCRVPTRSASEARRNGRAGTSRGASKDDDDDYTIVLRTRTRGRAEAELPIALNNTERTRLRMSSTRTDGSSQRQETGSRSHCRSANKIDYTLHCTNPSQSMRASTTIGVGESSRPRHHM